MSPLLAILSLLILIEIPAFVYAFFFAVSSSWNLLRLIRRSSDGAPADVELPKKYKGHLELVSGLRFSKETHGKEYGTECPVCLSVFVEGDYVKNLIGCKHCFHVVCIDKWLFSHSSCPVCRAFVPVIRTKIPPAVNEYDLRQGLPDAAGLV